MDLFRNDSFEIDLDLTRIKPEDITLLFQQLKECEECSQHPSELSEIEVVIWEKYWKLQSSQL